MDAHWMRDLGCAMANANGQSGNPHARASPAGDLIDRFPPIRKRAI
jgi:hypothetical protein